jgi:hypothetical protein
MKFRHVCLPTYFPDVDGTAGQLMRRWLDLLGESEALGFDSLWATLAAALCPRGDAETAST